MNKTNKNYKRSQRGRSMVEMLGVLAVVGVLSVGGVYGYGVAMKKHKANELLHQASMLAATISAQAMTNDGKLPETITSFGNSNYGTFSTNTTDALDGKGFTITIENVDSAVCDQLKEGGMIRNVTCDPNAKKATITYYKNLATNDEEGKNSPTGGSTSNTLVENTYQNFPDGMQCDEGVVCYITEGYDGNYYCSLRAECVDGALDSQADECCDSEEGCFEIWNIPACNTVL